MGHFKIQLIITKLQEIIFIKWDVIRGSLKWLGELLSFSIWAGTSVRALMIKTRSITMSENLQDSIKELCINVMNFDRAET